MGRGKRNRLMTAEFKVSKSQNPDENLKNFKR